MGQISFASIIVTYRCNAKCHMCYRWKEPSIPSEEIGLDVYEKLPFMDTVNVTGGEPFLRKDLPDIIEILRKKTNRLVISSNGFFTDRIIDLFESRQDIGLRVSLEGLPHANDELRGIKNGFDHGLRSILTLSRMGIKDIGFGITMSDKNATDMIELYQLAKLTGLEFATAAVHNAFYFNKMDNEFTQPDVAIGELKKLIQELLQSKRPKDWFRAYFNYGLINFIQKKPRLLPCEMGQDSFFLDPFGVMLPCNVLNEVMGNLRKQTFDEIWGSAQAQEVREKAANCGKNCWMMGSVSQQMKKKLSVPGKWLIKHKLLGKEICV